jgi:hypothetical protein
MDGLIYVSSVVILDSASRKRTGFQAGVSAAELDSTATLAAKVAHDLGVVLQPGGPALALIGSYEPLIMIVHGSQAAMNTCLGTANAADPLQGQVTDVFGDQLAVDGVRQGPSVTRLIRAEGQVGRDSSAVDMGMRVVEVLPSP